MPTVKKILLIYVSTLCVACGSLSSDKPTHLIDRDGIDIISVKEGVRTSYIKSKGNSEQLCSAPESDAVSDSGGSLTLSKIGYSNESSSSILGGRSELTLITRELMYRACELALNVGASKPETLDIYHLFLDRLLAISENTSSTKRNEQEQIQGDEDDKYNEEESDEDYE